MAGPGPGVGYDVMVSHVPADNAVVVKIIEHFTKNGLKVWKSKENADNGQAVVNCKTFVQVLSQRAAKSRSCQDELSLAYVSNTPIFPVGLDSFSKVAVHLDAGRKLMLAKINWTFLVDEQDYTTNLPQLIDCIKEKLSLDDKPAPGKEDEELDEIFFTMNDNMDLANVRRSSTAASDFWDLHFKGSTTIPWSEFQKHFLDEYKELIEDVFGQGKDSWIVNLVHRDIFSRVEKLSRDSYARFCGPNLNNDPDLFFTRVKDYAVSISAMKEVFDMDSTVRLTAVQQLGAYRTQAVLAILLDLIHDDDPNMRVVAALALGRSGRPTKRLVDELLRALEDDDRLVRESVCLSLGHLKAKRAVEAILDRWRNDPIRNVRDAADIALKKIGGEEVDNAMKVTKVLSDEMANLRTKKR